jgi:hypothetical protein
VYEQLSGIKVPVIQVAPDQELPANPGSEEK